MPGAQPPAGRATPAGAAMGQSQTLSRLAGWVYGAPEGLPALQDAEELAPGVLRLLGQNPGPATLQGTNTYLLGTGPERILVDTSDGNGSWWPLLRRALADRGARVGCVLLTHRHYDHTGGVAAVRTAFPEATVWKGPDELETPPPQAPPPAGATAEAAGGDVPPPPVPAADQAREIGGADRRHRRRWLSEAHQQGRGRCWCDGGVPTDCKVLTEGQAFAVGDATLRVLLTPGHSSDSACFLLEPAGNTPSSTAAILTGDTVLGGVAGRFDDLRAYMASLRLLLELAQERPTALFPGHGAAVAADSAASYLAGMLQTLTRRERAVRDVLRGAGGDCSVDEVCSSIYGDGMAASMAHEMVQQHVDVLVAKGLARENPGWLFSNRYETLEAPLEERGDDW